MPHYWNGVYTDPTLLQTLYTRNDYEMLAKIDSGSKSTQSWIGELRKQVTPATKSKSKITTPVVQRWITSYERKIEQYNKQIAKDPKRAAGFRKQIAKFKQAITDSQNKLKALRSEEAQRLAASRIDADAAIEQVFLRTVSRPPSSEEVAMAKQDIASAKTQVDGVRDLLWAMLNTKEFIINH